MSTTARGRSAARRSSHAAAIVQSAPPPISSTRNHVTRSPVDPVERGRIDIVLFLHNDRCTIHPFEACSLRRLTSVWRLRGVKPLATGHSCCHPARSTFMVVGTLGRMRLIGDGQIGSFVARDIFFKPRERRAPKLVHCAVIMGSARLPAICLTHFSLLCSSESPATGTDITSTVGFRGQTSAPAASSSRQGRP